MRYFRESEVQMSTTPGRTRSFLPDSLPLEPSNEETPYIDSADVDQFTPVPSPSKRTWLTFLIPLGIGVAATLAWQFYNDAAKEAIAPAATLKTMSADLETMRQSVDRLANTMAISQEKMTRSVDQLTSQVNAGLEQITREITELQAVEQQIFDKISMVPAPATGAKPVRPPRPPTVLIPARDP
jgi:uncharacterized membrane-anchored protein YhcB (DUF1043 family)